MRLDENLFFREALRESEERHRVTLQMAMDGFLRADMLGLIHPQDWDKMQESFEKSLREKVDTSTEFMIALPSGAAKHKIVEENRLASEVEIGSLSRMIRGKE